jgi:uncharacterized surface protein with fasciclin (FAS1) repeats
LEKKRASTSFIFTTLVPKRLKIYTARFIFNDSLIRVRPKKEEYVMKKVAMYTLLISALLLIGVCMGVSSSNVPGNSPGEMNIVDTAIAAGNLKTFVSALETTGLAGTLKGTGPFTVFAPTDAAFAKLSPEELNFWMANKKMLTTLLNYHVVPGDIMTANMNNGMTLNTVLGQNLTISLNDGSFRVDNATIVQADIVCTNGVIHVIDTVLMPRLASGTSNLNLSKSNINRMKSNSTDSTASATTVKSSKSNSND